ncbi:uncharacterized protein LOC144007740 [Festucalex cinctus]
MCLRRTGLIVHQLCWRMAKKRKDCFVERTMTRLDERQSIVWRGCDQHQIVFCFALWMMDETQGASVEEQNQQPSRLGEYVFCLSRDVCLHCHQLTGCAPTHTDCMFVLFAWKCASNHDDDDDHDDACLYIYQMFQQAWDCWYSKHGKLLMALLLLSVCASAARGWIRTRDPRCGKRDAPPGLKNGIVSHIRTQSGGHPQRTDSRVVKYAACEP